jgi:peptide/nickel transport system permease protein
MLSYVLRRLVYAIPVLLGVNIITFALFFLVNSPDDMARAHLGNKHVQASTVVQWKRTHGYDRPLFYNSDVSGSKQWTETLFFQRSIKLFLFKFGVADSGQSIANDIYTRLWPSLCIALPVLFIGLMVNLSFALLMIFFRHTRIDFWGVMLCVVLMSISGMFYIISGQYWVGKVLKLAPISGYDGGVNAFKFIVLPIFVAVLGGIGWGARWYRSIFLTEVNCDYVRTARAKGLSDVQTLFKHVLPNAGLPILTSVVAIIPSLFMGSLILESFFSIPGLGSYTIDAIAQQDFSIVHAMVFLGTVLHIIGLILTDVAYVLFDPRVRLNT